MSKFVCALLVWLVAFTSAPTFAVDYVEGSVIGVSSKSPSVQNPVFFMNTYTGVGIPEAQWTYIDVSTIVPADTKAIRLDGLLLITHGSMQETCDYTIAFRTSTDLEYEYLMQTIETAPGGGQRGNAGTWVALDSSHRFQVKWTKSTTGQWPDHCAYGANLRLTAYLR